MLLLSSLLGGTASAAVISGVVEAPSEVADYEVWLVNDLDLSAPEQPLTRASVDSSSGAWSMSWEGEGPFWIVLRQRFVPHFGPPIDLFLPVDLLPFEELPTGTTKLSGIDPELLMKRQKLSMEPALFGRWLGIVLIVLLGGFVTRWVLRRQAAPPGDASAPLRASAFRSRPGRSERKTIFGILGVAALLRFQGMFSESLDLLEVSYLPGIGRPSPFGGGANGLQAVPHMLREMAELYCLDLVHPPLYHLMLGVMRLLGPADWLLRLPGLASSLGTVWLLWLLMRRWGPSVGILSALLYALAGPSIYFGQDATPYAAVGLVAVASVLAMVRALEWGRNSDWTIYFIVITLGFFCHYNLAILGIAELLTLLGLAWFGRSEGRWPAAVHRAMGPALAIAPAPLIWVWFHVSTFPTVAQDTRLVADTYAPDPGWASFLWDFFSVNAGLDAGATHWAGAAAVPLVLLGVWGAVRPRGATGRREEGPPFAIGILLISTFVTFVVSVGFFYLNVREHLGGRVFYGFRWVGWSHPLLIALVALGLLRGSLDRRLRALLAALWITGMLAASWGQITKPSRPDYAGVVQFIRQNLADRDAVATLPAWFQRGNLSHYLMASGPVGRQPQDGEGVWLIDGKRVVIEAVHPSLPFETTARNSHIERLWVAKVEESMSGRAKFSEEIADQALDWADKHLTLVERWPDRFDRIELSLYEVRSDELVPPPGSEMLLSAEQTVLNHRMYPSVTTRGLQAAEAFELPVRLGRTPVYQAPITPGCVDWPFRGLKEELQPEAETHWNLLLRLPLKEGQAAPIVLPQTPVQMTVEEGPRALTVRAVGGPCDTPPLQLKVRYP